MYIYISTGYPSVIHLKLCHQAVPCLIVPQKKSSKRRLLLCICKERLGDMAGTGEGLERVAIVDEGAEPERDMKDKARRTTFKMITSKVFLIIIFFFSLIF